MSTKPGRHLESYQCTLQRARSCTVQRGQVGILYIEPGHCTVQRASLVICTGVRSVYSVPGQRSEG
jgi:hypothetical protein